MSSDSDQRRDSSRDKADLIPYKEVAGRRRPSQEKKLSIDQNKESKDISGRRSSQGKKDISEHSDDGIVECSVQPRRESQEKKPQLKCIEEEDVHIQKLKKRGNTLESGNKEEFDVVNEEENSQRSVSQEKINQMGSSDDEEIVPRQAVTENDSSTNLSTINSTHGKQTNSSKPKSNYRSVVKAKNDSHGEKLGGNEFAYEKSKLKTATPEKSMAKLNQFLSIKKAQSNRQLDIDDASRGAYSTAGKGKSSKKERTNIHYSGSASVASFDPKSSKLKSPTKHGRLSKSSGKSARDLNSPSPHPSPLPSENSQVDPEIRQVANSSKHSGTQRETQLAGQEMLESPSTSANRSVKTNERRRSKEAPGMEKIECNDDASCLSSPPRSSKRSSASRATSLAMSPGRQKAEDKNRTKRESPRCDDLIEIDDIDADENSDEGQLKGATQKQDSNDSLTKRAQNEAKVSKRISGRHQLESVREDDIQPPSETLRKQSPSKSTVNDETLKTSHLRRLVDPNNETESEPLDRFREAVDKSSRLLAGTRRASLAASTNLANGESDRHGKSRDGNASSPRGVSRRSSDFVTSSPKQRSPLNKPSSRGTHEVSKKSREEESDAVREAAVAALEAAIAAVQLAGLNVDIKLMPSPELPVNVRPSSQKNASDEIFVSPKVSKSNNGSNSSSTSKTSRRTSTESNSSAASNPANNSKTNRRTSTESSSSAASNPANSSKTNRRTSTESNSSVESSSQRKVSRSKSGTHETNASKTNRRSSAESSTRIRSSSYDASADVDDSSYCRSDAKQVKTKNSEAHGRRKTAKNNRHGQIERDDVFTFFCWSSGQRTDESTIQRERQRMKDSMEGSPLNKAYARFSALQHYG